MERVRSCLALLAVLVTVPLVPHQSVAAQSSPAVSCVSQPLSSPAPGHYSGAWHSDGDYHFAVFNTDVDLKIVIDGTLDIMVAAGGQISGRVTGNVNAPITDFGHMDISSGIGSISGQVTGSITGPNSTLVLDHPVIDML